MKLLANVLNDGENGIDQLLSCFHYALEVPSARCSSGSVPHRDADGQGALCCVSIKGAHNEILRKHIVTE